MLESYKEITSISLNKLNHVLHRVGTFVYL